jgi:hypothetical protein
MLGGSRCGSFLLSPVGLGGGGMSLLIGFTELPLAVRLRLMKRGRSSREPPKCESSSRSTEPRRAGSRVNGFWVASRSFGGASVSMGPRVS